jgi:hypothetical protein
MVDGKLISPEGKGNAKVTYDSIDIANATLMDVVSRMNRAETEWALAHRLELIVKIARDSNFYSMLEDEIDVLQEHRATLPEVETHQVQGSAKPISPERQAVRAAARAERLAAEAAPSGQKVSELTASVRAMFKGSGFDKAVGIYQTVEDALKAAGIKISDAMLSVKSDRLKLEGTAKQWFQAMENRVPKDLMNEVMQLVNKKDKRAAMQLLIGWAKSENERINSKWSQARRVPPPPPRFGRQLETPVAVARPPASKEFTEAKLKMEKQAAVSLARQKQAYDDGALMDPQMEQALRIYANDPKQAATEVAYRMGQERQKAMRELDAMGINGISLKESPPDGGPWDADEANEPAWHDEGNMNAEMEADARNRMRLSTLEMHYIMDSMDRAMDARLEYTPDTNGRTIAQTIQRLRETPTSANFLTEFDKTAQLSDTAEQHKDSSGGVWRRYPQTKDRAEYIDDGAGGRVKANGSANTVTALTSRAYSSWCTSQGAAAHQLEAGDFWVYSDADGKTQLALRMQDDGVGEIQDRANNGRVQPEFEEKYQWLIDNKLLPESANKELSERLREVVKSDSTRENRAMERRLQTMLDKVNKSVSDAAQILQILGLNAAEVGEGIVIRGDYTREYILEDTEFGGQVEPRFIPDDIAKYINYIEGDLVADMHSGVGELPNLRGIGGEVVVSGVGLRHRTPDLKADYDAAQKAYDREVALSNARFARHIYASGPSTHVTKMLGYAKAQYEAFGDSFPDKIPLAKIDNKDFGFSPISHTLHALERQLKNFTPGVKMSARYRDMWARNRRDRIALEQARAHDRDKSKAGIARRNVTFDDMDDDVEIPFSRKADGTIQGFYDPKGGKSYLIADGIAKGEEMAVLLHEVGVHMGMEKMLGAEKYKQLIGQIKKWESGLGLNKQIAQAARERVNQSGAKGEQADHELLAYFVEEAVKAGIDPTKLGTSALAKWMNQVWDAVKAALEAIGWDTSKLEARDVVALAHGAAQMQMDEAPNIKRNAKTLTAPTAAPAAPAPAKTSSGVTVVEHNSVGYQARTKHNADSAGLTVAIAADFSTAGEKLTAKVSEGKYLPIALDVAAKTAGTRIAKAMRQMGTSTLNVAGNGIYTLGQMGRHAVGDRKAHV